MNSKYIMKAGLFLAIALTTSQQLHAADQKISVFAQLDQLRSENAILTEALKNAELKNKISNGQSKNPAAQLGFTPSAMSAPIISIPESFPYSSAQVQMVSGTKNNLTALISLSNGSRINAKVNSNIAGIGTVKSISLNEVIVSNKSQTMSLAFAGEATSYSNNSMSSMSPSMQLSGIPPMPQMPPLPPIPPGMMSGGGR